MIEGVDRATQQIKTAIKHLEVAQYNIETCGTDLGIYGPVLNNILSMLRTITMFLNNVEVQK